MNIYNMIAGLLVGTVVGVTGTGGGALMTPILVWLFGVAPVTAVGTDLWLAALTKACGGGVYIRRGMVDWLVLRRLCTGSIPASLATLGAIHFIGIGKVTNHMVLAMLGIVLLVTAVAMVLKPRLYALGRDLRLRHAQRFKAWQPPLTILMGVVLGILVTLTSVGAGTLGVVMLVYLYPLRMSAGKLVGTDIVHAIPLAVVAGLGYLVMGQVNFGLLANLLAGSVPGVLIGSTLGSKLPEKYWRMSIALVLVILGAKMTWLR